MAPRLRLSEPNKGRLDEIRNALQGSPHTETVDAARMAEMLATVAPLSSEEKRYACRLIAKTLAATYLRTARQEMGWTQREMSEAMGLKNGYVPQSESTNADFKVPIDYLVHVALVTGQPLYVGEPSVSTDALVLRVRHLEKEVKELKLRLDAETELNNSLFRKFDSRTSIKKEDHLPGG